MAEISDHGVAEYLTVPPAERGTDSQSGGSHAAPESEQEPPEKLDGPAMYAEGLGYLRLARSASNEYVERDALARAVAYFAGAQAAAMAAVVADNGTGDLDERRWRAAVAGDDLPEEGA